MPNKNQEIISVVSNTNYMYPPIYDWIRTLKDLFPDLPIFFYIIIVFFLKNPMQFKENIYSIISEFSHFLYSAVNHKNNKIHVEELTRKINSLEKEIHEYKIIIVTLEKTIERFEERFITLSEELKTKKKSR